MADKEKTLNQAVRQICEQTLTPGFYMGVHDKTVDKRSSFWRDKMFPAANDIVHDKKYMFWHEFRDMYPTLMPTDICPCDEGDYIATSNSYTERVVSQGYWWLGFPVDCDWEQLLMPGENPFASRSFSAAVQDHMLDLREKLFNGFDQKEEYWSVMMATVGEVMINPKGGKPYMLQFKRDKDLNCSIDDPECQWCFDPKKDDSKARPWDDIRRMDDKLWEKNRGGIDTVIMNKQTCDWLRNAMSKFVERCKDVPTAQILSPTAVRLAGYELPPQMDGARLEFVMPIGQRQINIWCVETTFQFCDPDTGEEICVNPLADGKVYGYNLGVSNNNRFGGRFAFGRIQNFHSTQERQKRFFHQHITDNGKSMKYHGESAPTVLIECPNSSVCLDVCGGALKAAPATRKVA